MKIQLTEFSKRHFDKDFKGTKILNTPPDQLEFVLNSLVKGLSVDNIQQNTNKDMKLIDGYAPFCKLLVVPNFTNTKTGTIPITDDISPFIKTEYVARTEEELPILTRWVELPDDKVSTAKYLVFVLYTREQLLKESEKDQINSELDIDTDFGIVAILAQMSNKEEPMKPITIMRNALGIDEGGSGVKLDKDDYIRSVEFWSRNVIVK